ncbi:NF kappa B activating protein [Echinococcus multilocularis]|uniref:NF kappa B activating protein n=1 Tax=Echinococcus multilocularis TaxID=6211 RepID=A0A068YL97_ECHMU|nr:NF kappa B activating protein [Echinococcus multilocularis]
MTYQYDVLLCYRQTAYFAASNRESPTSGGRCTMSTRIQRRSSHHRDRSRSPFGESRRSRHRQRSLSPFGNEFKKSDSDYYNQQNRKYKPFEIGYQTPEFWQNRRQAREDAGASGNKKIWGLPPEEPYTDSGDEYFEITREGPLPPSTPSSDKNVQKKRKNHEESKMGKPHKHHHHNNRHHHKKTKKKRRHSSSTSSSSSSTSADSEEDEARSFIRQMKAKKAELERKRQEEEEATEIIGPMLPGANGADSTNQRIDYGKALLPGEGAAMAAYIAEGKRIPRRGEIGLTSEEIEKFEQVGYVMSGSRHHRMEAVRLRKENQIYSADEKRALESFNHSERAKREAKLQAQFKALVKKKLEDKQNVGM